MKKDYFVRFLRLVVGFGVMGYSLYLFYFGMIIVNDFMKDFNNIFLSAIGFIGLFIVCMGIFDLCLPKPRLIAFLFGATLILLSHYFLKDNPEKFVLIGDMLKILGVFLMIAGPIGFCVTSKCNKKIEESKVIEIIEV